MCHGARAHHLEGFLWVSEERALPSAWSSAETGKVPLIMQGLTWLASTGPSASEGTNSGTLKGARDMWGSGPSSGEWAVRDSGAPKAVPEEKGIERVLLRVPDFSQSCGHMTGVQHHVRLTCTEV